jgi:hypothetical protein
VIDAINVRDAGLQKAQAGGLTTVNVMPGSGHLLSGQTVYLKLRDGKTIDDLMIKLPDGSMAGGMKMANGTNSIRAAPFPGTRAKSAALVREQFVKAREYRDKLQRFVNDPEKRPARDLSMEALLEVLDGSASCIFTPTATTTSSPSCACRRNSAFGWSCITSAKAGKSRTRSRLRRCRARSS